MGQAKLKREMGVQPKARIDAGMVKTLAMDFATDNGAPVVKLDFGDVAVQPIDFRLAPIDAMRLFDLLDRPFEDFWQAVTPADLIPSPSERMALACGGTSNIAVTVATETGLASFRIKFFEDAPIASIEFTLPPPLATALMSGIAASAQEFHWLDSLKAYGEYRRNLH